MRYWVPCVCRSVLVDAVLTYCAFHWLSSFTQYMYVILWHIMRIFCTLWPLAERGACRVDQISGAYGWWGERTRFLTSLPFCRTENYVPGLHLLTFQHPRNQSQPDKVWQVQPWALMTLALDTFSFLCTHIWFSPVFSVLITFHFYYFYYFYLYIFDF